jgi:nitric oxide dioxygenase
MTPEQLYLVESSVASLGPVLDDVVAAFYDRLFEIAPETRALFSGSLSAQRAKFAAELAFIVTTIRRHDAFVASASELGRRHGAVGVQPEQFRTAGAALLDALAGVLGPAWTPALSEAWRLAYRLTAEAMMAGAG